MTLFRSTVVGLLSTLAASLTLAVGAGAADLAETTWTTEGGAARVTFIDDEAEGLVGRITWLRREEATGEPVLDTKNPEASLQSRPLVGVSMVWGFEETGDGVWDGGRIYAADTGRTYNAKMTLDGDMLVVTGCIRWPACRDQSWTRFVEE